MPSHKNGVLLSIGASVLFGLLYYYTTLLSPLNGEQIFGWRTLLTWPFLTLFLIYRAEWSLAGKLLRSMYAKPQLIVAVMFTTSMLGCQLWLFMWAPLHGRGLQVSLGYFLLPLTMVLAGRFVFKERLSRHQQAAVALAILGVANQFVVVGAPAWETMLVALGYPFYFIVRRALGTDNLGGLWLDMSLMLPVAAFFAIFGPDGAHAFALSPALYLLVPVLGIISAAALICYILASRILPLGLFGLLGYVEPVLLVAVALLIGESIAREEWLTYIAVWLGLLCLMVEGLQKRRTR